MCYDKLGVKRPACLAGRCESDGNGEIISAVNGISVAQEDAEILKALQHGNNSDICRLKNEAHMKEIDGMIFGIRAIIEAINAGKEVEKVLIKRGLQSELYGELKKLIKDHNLPVQEVPGEKLDRVTRKNHQGCIAFISPVEFQNAEEIVYSLFEKGKVPLLLIADRVTDVRNFGAICRTAECAGVDAVIIPARGSAQLNADAVKTSAGAIMRIPICRSMNLKDTLRMLSNSGVQLFAATEKATDVIYTGDFTVPTAIIVGSEEDGVSPEYLRLCDHSFQIPMMGDIASLNVGAAAAIMLFEVVRQRVATV